MLVSARRTVHTNIHLSAHLLSVTAAADAVHPRAAAATGGAEPESFASRRSAGLILFCGNGGVDVASATCVEVGGRCFLATAGHNLDGLARDRDLRIVPPRSSRSRWLPFLGRSATRHRPPDSYDVGWIEIDPAVAGEAGLTFLDAGSLADSAAGDPKRDDGRADPAGGRQYLVHGLPAGLAVHGLHACGRVIHLTLLGYRTSASGDEAQVHRGRLSLRYDWTETDASPHRDLFRGRLPAAYGLSGGGVWRLADGRSEPRLVAIVRAWHRREQRLSSVPIERWLELVRRDFDDLRPAIDPLLEDRRR